MKSFLQISRCSLFFYSIVASLLFFTAPNSALATPLLGFTSQGAADEEALEKKYDSFLSASEQRSWLERMSSAPNHVGSPHDKKNAEFILDQFREWGWEAHIETFYVLYPTPRKIGLEMVQPKYFKARLSEPAVAGDRTSSDKTVLPPCVAFGADGDVTGELVYVNTGMPDDYRELERHGISVKDKIVITRYGGGWRGLKPKLAAEHGAIGCLIYSDPGDDGYAEGDVYPKGAHRPPDGVQRGSVLDLPVAPGDPLTPGIGATRDAPRISREEAKTLAKIPVLPISYADAQPLLAALAGPVAPASWRGALPITYHIGPGPARVHLTVESDWNQKEIYNVIAMIRGREYPDQWVIRGNHHDGWVFGAWDPLSAHCALMSEAKGIGTLVKQGWHPRRTIVYASWDAEEPALIGSTEWVEEHANELKEKGVLYVNSDTNGRGFLRMAGSHCFQSLVHEVAGDVSDPETGVDVLARLKARVLVGNLGRGNAEERRVVKAVNGGAPPPLEALGSGSDYSPFLQHAGIASLDIRYGGEDEDYGIYHSIYDSFDHYIRFGDPDFSYGVSLSKTIGRIILRAADADVIPMHLTDFAETVEEYAREVHKLADDMRSQTEQQHRLFEENAFKLSADPIKLELPPERDSDVPFLNFAALDNATSRLKKAASQFDKESARLLRHHSSDKKAQARINAALQKTEESLTYEKGLPGRPWFRHMIYAPGLYTGYGVKTLPGLREAIEERRWAEAEEYSKIIANVLNTYSDKLNDLVKTFP
ncbi:MAG TPA: M28 family metallopeptidase [Verrucomicrobiae bacterium]|nr:M28 family metallopeptidase [Verrucomicrobiae bacterium]